MTDLEDRKRMLGISKQKYYLLGDKLHHIRRELLDLEKHRGHSPAFRSLMASVEVMQDQIAEDHNRYVKRVLQIDARSEMKELQKALNRERLKRETLESKIEEAKTSSGLFIKYVKSKLGV